MANQSFRFQDFYEPKPTPHADNSAHRAAEPAQQAADASYRPEPAPAPQPYAPRAAEPAVTAPQPQPDLGWESGPIVAPGAWTGMQRFGWLLVGAFGGVFGILVASMANIGHPYRSEATKMAAFGFAAAVILSVLAGAGAALLLSSTVSIAVNASAIGL